MGFASRTKAWIQDTYEADLWVMNTQLEFSEDRKSIPNATLSRVRGTNGVAWAVPMYKGYLKARLPDSRLKTIRVIGIDDASLVGGPPKMIQGTITDLRRDASILVDESEMKSTLATKDNFGKLKPLVVGDHISLNDHDAVIAGTFQRSREFFWEPLIYTTYSRAITFAPQEREMLNFVLVKIKSGESITDVAQKIAIRTGLQALTPAQFQSFSMWYILVQTGILVNFGITIVLGIVIGILVSGQLFYTFVLDNLRHYASMKAMGVTNRVMRRMVMIQVLVVGFIGYGIGLGAAAVTGYAASGDSLAFQMTWYIPIFSFLAVLMSCILASLISLRRVLALEPAVVFKG
jgi:putative ABC transport system permease protein